MKVRVVIAVLCVVAYWLACLAFVSPAMAHPEPVVTIQVGIIEDA